MKVGDLLARYKPAEKTVRILLDGSVLSRIDETKQQLKQARRTESVDGLSSRVPLIEKEIQELETQSDQLVIKLRAIPGEEFDAMKLVYPPTDLDFKRFREAQQARAWLDFAAPDVDRAAMSPALIGKSIVEVDGVEVDWDEHDGKKLWAGLHDGARAELALAAWEVNEKPSSRPLFETATGTTSSTGSESTTPADKEFPSLRLAEGS